MKAQPIDASPASLEQGFYWLESEGNAPVVVEKRDNEGFVRFTNGARQSYPRVTDRFWGPLEPPSPAPQRASKPRL